MVTRTIEHVCGHKGEHVFCTFGIDKAMATRAQWKCEECCMYEQKQNACANIQVNPNEIKIDFAMF